MTDDTPASEADAKPTYGDAIRRHHDQTIERCLSRWITETEFDDINAELWSVLKGAPIEQGCSIGALGRGLAPELVEGLTCLADTHRAAGALDDADCFLAAASLLRTAYMGDD